MRRLLFSAGFFLLCMVVYGNNIRVNGEARVVDFVGPGRDTAIVEFGVSWDNSWRDDFNWDAAWVFLKYKKRGLTAPWEHAYLSREGHESVPQSGDTGSYDFMVGEVGEGASSKVTGLFLMRDGISEGSVDVKLRLKWPLQGNGRLPLKAEDFGVNLDSVFVAAYAIEMVYVPYGGFYFGDGFSNKSFFRQGKGLPLPAEADIMNNVSGYEYTIDKPILNGVMENIADKDPQSAYPYSTLYFQAVGGAYLQIDFRSPKMIRYFAIAAASNHSGGSSDCRPKGNWYLKGSNDLTDWEELYTGTGDDWLGSASSYPVQNTLKVQHPGSYRYYRIVMSGARRSDDGIVIQNIAMTEEDLERAVIDSEDPLYLIAADGQTWKHQLPAAYPKGYRGFYAMKYEVSQEQYVEFLNSLTLAQQKNRVMNNDFEHMSKGDYVFGDVKRPNCRNGIAFLMQKGEGAPALFGNNLNADNKFYSEDDGQTLACNYLSPADMLAYCDWSGLRPMSELEYEKSCRRPSPQIPEKGEYAWNSNSGVNRLRTLSDLTGAQTERETPFDYKVNVNAGGRLNGPVRSGAFATSRTGQLEAGATYWGLMEMSGNLWELCYNATTSGAVFKGDDVSYSHGDGTLNADGSTDISASYWPSAVAAFGVRGGSFVSADSLLRTSDRTCSWGNFFLNLTKRDSSVGFRGVRSMLNTAGFTAGRIYCANGLEQDTTCHRNTYFIKGIAAEKTVGKTTYAWYVSEDNGTSWSIVEGATGISLECENLINESTSVKSLKFKRKAVCSIGEQETEPVTLVIYHPVLAEIEGSEFIAYDKPTQYAVEVKNSEGLNWDYRWTITKQKGMGSGTIRIDNNGSCEPSLNLPDTSSVWKVSVELSNAKCTSLSTEKVVKVTICPYAGSDLYMDATHQCVQRTTGYKNWQAWIKDKRDKQIYRIVQISDDYWWTGDNMNYTGISKKTCQGMPMYDNTANTRTNICPPGWTLPTQAEAINTLTNDKNIFTSETAGYGLKFLAGYYAGTTCYNSYWVLRTIDGSAFQMCKYIISGNWGNDTSWEYCPVRCVRNF